ncbi:MAG: TonB-dependent receptor plug domain-containing protein, partial [Asticcacaulis sp.]
MHSLFRLSKVLNSSSAMTIAFALSAAAVTSPVLAQTTNVNSTPGETVVVVTGIRKGIADAIARKKNSNEIIDSIVAEDVGKFPDSNVAEALQRISGVSIDRSGGEGQHVTVRGFGPSFNTVLINGRRLASDGAGSAFSFDLIPADLIGGADVYKSSDVSLQEGGIGSTINLRLQHPLDIRHFSAVLSAKGVYDVPSQTVSPQVFGFISNTFDGGKLGVLLSASYQQRQTSNDQVIAGQAYIKDAFAATDLSRIFADGKGNGAGAYTHQQQTNYNRANEKRDRLGVSAVVQYRP